VRNAPTLEAIESRVPDRLGMTGGSPVTGEKWKRDSSSLRSFGMTTKTQNVRAMAIASVCVVLLLAGGGVEGQKQKKHPPASPVELNSATAEQLEQLPGIGPSTAQAIVEFREKSGPFQRPEDLLAIHGMSKAKFEKLRPYVTVKAPPEAKR
jgi:competence ComEA-like helix-hairpin-helix protein